MSDKPQHRPPTKKRHSKLQRLLCCSSSSSAVLSPFDVHPPTSASQPIIGNGVALKHRPHFIAFDVPRLTTKTPYDHSEEGFWDFPERAGWMLDGKAEYRKFPNGIDWDTKELDERPPDSLNLKCFRIDGSDTSLSEEVAFQQAWLFFGVVAELSVISGASAVLAAEKVPGTQSEMKTSTAVLDTLHLKWLNALKAYSADERDTRLKRMLQVVKHVLSLQTVISTQKSDVEEPRLLTYEECKVLLSIRLLFRAILLTLALSGGCDLTELQFLMNPQLQQSFPANWDELKDFSIDEMLANGWCKSECKLLEPMDGCYNFFATRLTRWPMDHSKCNDFICRADQVNEETYKTVHVEPHCQCSVVTVHPEDLCKVLDKGKVPRIIISKDFKLSMSESQPYAVISHVWSHGLGNPNENALPLCQVRRLKGYLSGLQKAGEPDLALWIDTLCMPVQANLKEQRKKAMGLLSKTSQEAAAVLVLDRELQKLDDQRISMLEQSMMLAFVGWTRRLWTLQEAALARRLYIQTLGGPCEVENSKPPVDDKERLTSDISFRENIESLMRDRIPPISTLRKSVFEKSATMSVTTTALQRLSFTVKHRCTSKMEDEAIILGIILGLDVKALLDAENLDDRMSKFLAMIREIPSDIIFGNVERIQQAPYRWAPRSLLNFPIFNMQSFGPPAICDSRGLHARYQGLLLESASHAQADGGKYYACDQVSGMKYEFSIRENQPDFELSDTPALIFRPFFIGGDTVVADIARRLTEKDQTILEVKVVGYLQMVASGGLDITDRRILKGSLTEKEQRWCIT
ncbi:unnamed protein product [Somion occarium]|uniref:Heterokaryon incompatibility domain-containing protein n=1 Tax=Somion occarium TaxID=3059160 RepID=A0ABP1DQ56_9APHY